VRCGRSGYSVTLRRGVAGVLAGVCLAVGAAAASESADWHVRLSFGDRWAEVEPTPLPAGLSSYRFRAGGPGAALRERRVTEAPGQPHLRSGNPLFDGLFALAVEEAADDSVDEITDAQFNDGRAIPCRCFETGAKWHYVWTRDISYAVDLGLAVLDPARALASLRFKESGLRRAAGDVGPGPSDRRLVAQDTGSGGSWPVSTDRVAWIHAAVAALRALPPSEAAGIETELRRVAEDTLEQDRDYAFDARAGLYRGETSFLDWREQSYPPWTRDDTRFIAESFSLSTNVLHYVALRDAAMLERRAHASRAAALEREADALRQRIDARFWQADAGLYASYLGPDLAPVAAYDLLGLALAVIHGVADEHHARAILAHYPETAAGPPVIWPQQPGIAIYHNRAVWPFASAYALAAARRARDPARMTAFMQSLMRGAALALSNMENFEFLTLETSFDDGPRSGPVINSSRQLWSVGGYAGSVVHGLFGIRAADDGVHVEPELPGALATRLFAPDGEIALEQLRIRGQLLRVRLRLPAHWSDGDLLEAGTISVAGAALSGTLLPDSPSASNVVSEVLVTLVARGAQGSEAPRVSAGDAHALTDSEQRRLFATPAPQLESAWRAGTSVRLAIAGVPPGGRWRIYRDGILRASGRGGEPFRDHVAERHRTACYVATAEAAAGGLRSLPSAELCLEGADSRHSFTAASGSLASPDGHAPTAEAGEPRYAGWGAPGQRLELAYVAPAAGLQRLQLRYGNDSGPVNTGITAAVKRVTARCGASTERGVVVMPHLPRATLGWSTGFVFGAPRGGRCRIEIGDGSNMSDLEHFVLYTGGRGGRDGPRNRADVVAAQIDAIERPALGGR
jgi:hypothetical protein